MRRWGRVGVLLVLGLSLGLLLLLGGSFALSRFRESAEATAGLTEHSRFVQARDLALHVTELGPEGGMPIVFIHGTGAWAGLWLETMEQFAAAGYRCVAVDVPPFGYSEKRGHAVYGNREQALRILEVLSALQLQRVVLFGHSFGGGATVETALLAPEKVAALVLEDIGGLHLGGGEGSAGGATPWLLGQPWFREPLLAATATNPLFTRKLLGLMVHDQRSITPEHIAILQAPLRVRGATHALGDWLFQAAFPASPSLTSNSANYPKLTMPALLLWGAQDTIIPLSAGETLAALLPQSRLVVLPQVNHIPHIEALPRVMQATLPFLRESLGPSESSR